MSGRKNIGIWSELSGSSRWKNEGVSRVVGFLIEGAAACDDLTFRVVIPRDLADVAREDLRTLAAVEGVHWTLHSPEQDEAQEPHQAGSDEMSARYLARFANAHVPVDGWVVTFPFFTAAKLLEKPKATLFPDALPFDFPWAWQGDAFWGPEGHWPNWRAASNGLMRESDSVITFSRHVASRHIGRLFEVDPSKIHVIPLAPPDLSRFIAGDASTKKTEASRRAAADTLREYAKTREWNYLETYPFEECDYIVISTQDRVTKNIAKAVEALDHLVRSRHRNLKIIMTAPIHYGADWTLLPATIQDNGLFMDVISATDLPRDVHAALYHCAALTVHPSFFEGIVGALPLFESISVGTPALTARGPHINELLQLYPAMGKYTFDPYSKHDLAGLIETTLDARDLTLLDQVEMYSDFSERRTWARVALEYANAAVGAPPPKHAAWNDETP